jgi:putative transposase
VSRFALLAGIPERTYWRRLARHRAGAPAEGPWPAPKTDAVEAIAAKYAADWPAWGHRKIAAMMRADGYEVSTSTVERALRRRGLLLPSGFRADRRSWSRLRKRVFRDPPRQRNRVWQMDFSEFETARGGIWRICAVIDYASKYCLATTVTPTSRGQDALACLRRAVVEAERVLDLDNLRADRGWMNVVNADDFVIGEAPAPIAVVTDNGPVLPRDRVRGGVHRRRPAVPPRPHAGAEPTDQRRGRAVLRHAEVRAPVSGCDRRRQRPGRRDQLLPPHLQHVATAPSPQRLDAAARVPH